MSNCGQFDAEVYNETNLPQLVDGRKHFEATGKLFNGGTLDTVVDIGCGSGNVTTMLNNYITCKQIVGFDVKPEMVDFARQNHGAINVRYEVGDITDDFQRLVTNVQLTELADLVVSVNCLHWEAIHHETIISNIYKMLKPGGIAHLKFIIGSEVFPIVERVIWFPRWRKYFPKLVQAQIDPLGFAVPSCEHMLSDWKKSARKAGFKTFGMKIMSEAFYYKNLDEYLDAFENIFTYFKEIPEEDRLDFKEDIKSIIHDSCNCYQNCYPKFRYKYEVVTMYMEKPLESMN